MGELDHFLGVKVIQNPQTGDPAAVWGKLANRFQKRTWANKLELRRNFFSLRLKNGESVQEHTKAMTEIFDGLSVIGDSISEEDRVVHLLASLPDSYNMLVTALEANVEVPKIEVVTERLLHKERKLKERTGVGASSERAMTGKQRPKARGPKCHHCGKFGHIRLNCDEWIKLSQCNERVRTKFNTSQKETRNHLKQAGLQELQPSTTGTAQRTARLSPALDLFVRGTLCTDRSPDQEQLQYLQQCSIILPSSEPSGTVSSMLDNSSRSKEQQQSSTRTPSLFP